MAGTSTGIRTFEVDVSISGPLDVPFEDWPAKVQDVILAAMERKSAEEQIPLKIVHAKYMVDHDKQKDEPGRHYLHVIASEVVMADARTIDPKRIIGELPDDIKRLLN